MSGLTIEQINSVKGKGFLRNRGTENFSMRIVAHGAVFSANDFANISKLANLFGNGKVICTSRLGVEVPGIPYEKISEAENFANSNGLRVGGTGAKIRPIAACKGSTCVYGNCDTHRIAAKIDEDFFVKWNNIKLPHKFKITVGGCPNSCMKPSINDFGIEGHKIPKLNLSLCRGCKKCLVETACPTHSAKKANGKIEISDNCISCGVCIGKCHFKAVAHESETLFKIFVGGTCGKSARIGNSLSKTFKEDEIYSILEKSLLWFKENGYAKERFGVTIDRIGFDNFEKAIYENDILKRKEEILKKDILTKQ